MPRIALLALLSATLIPSPAAAQTTTSRSTGRDVVQILLPAGVWLAIDLGLDLGPDSCGWCDRDADGRDTLNGFDRRIRSGLMASGAAADRASRASDVLVYGLLLPTSIIVPGSRGDDGLRVSAISGVLWAHATTTLATSLSKDLIRRERPYFHFSDRTDVDDTSRNKSFFSGHTSTAFSAVFSTIEVCRYAHCGGERWLWIIGVPTATTVGLLRIIADKHYATDVLAGASVGATLGWLTPKLIRHFTTDDAGTPGGRPAIVVSANGASLTWRW